MNLNNLNIKYTDLRPEERLRNLREDFPDQKILVTSSFGTTSVYLLHLLSKNAPELEVYFINTTYLFEDTLAYKKKLENLLNLKVVDLLPEKWENDFTREDETWKKNPDFCCYLNKVKPVKKLRKNFDIWISGLIGEQNDHRKDLEVFQDKGDILKFHPVIDVSLEEAKAHIAKYQLPIHPLIVHGFESVGCVQCTSKGKGRRGRWEGKEKMECGIHR